MRRIVIERRTDAMRRLCDADRSAAIDASRNVIGFDRFTPFSARVRQREIAAAVSISKSEVIA